MSGALTYHDDFADSNSGWPNRSDNFPAEMIPVPQKWPVIGPGSYSMRYVSSGYEMANRPPPVASGLVFHVGYEGSHAFVFPVVT